MSQQHDLQRVSLHFTPEVSSGSDAASRVYTFLQALSVMDYASAKQHHSGLSEHSELTEMNPLFERLLTQHEVVYQRGDVFYCGGEPTPQFSDDLDAAIQAAGALTGKKAPLILLHFTRQLGGFFLTRQQCDGLIVMAIPTTSPRFPNNLRSTLFHETAHAFLTTGYLYPDEGFANWFAREFSGEAPLSPVAAVTLPWTLRQRLGVRSTEGIGFESLGASVEQGLILREQATSFICQLVDRVGHHGLMLMLNLIHQGGTAEQALEWLFSRPVDDLEKTLPQLDLADCIRTAGCRAWLTTDVAPLAHLLEGLSSIPSSDKQTLLTLALRLERARIMALAGEKCSDDELNALDALLTKLDGMNVPQARVALLRGNRESLAILLARPNLIKVVLCAQKALHAYEKARLLDKHDAETQLNLGILLLHMPEPHGGGVARGLDLIRPLVRDPVFGSRAQSLMASYGNLPASQTTTPPESVPAGKIAASDVAVLTAKNIVLNLPAFSLRIASLTLPAGENLAVIGANGAGKTLLMDAILGHIAVDEGELILCGHPVTDYRHRPALRKQLGAQLQDMGMNGEYRVSEIVEMQQVLYGQLDAGITDALSLQELMKLKHRQLSRGQKQRLQLFTALAHQPRLALLDEPSLGLDEWHCRALRNILQQRVKLGLSTLLISHIAEDIAVCDRLICLQQGRIIDEGDIFSVVQRNVGQYRATLSADCPASVMEMARQLHGLKHHFSPKNREQLLYGDETFATAFRLLIEQNQLAAFSLYPTQLNDLLAHLSRGNV